MDQLVEEERPEGGPVVEQGPGGQLQQAGQVEEEGEGEGGQEVGGDQPPQAPPRRPGVVGHRPAHRLGGGGGGGGGRGGGGEGEGEAEMGM